MNNTGTPSASVEKISPAGALRGHVLLPGDKSISHRYAMLAAIAEGTSTLYHFSSGADPHSTLNCVEALGVRVERTPELVRVHGQGPQALQAPQHALDVGNSGSTIRMMSGILAAQPFDSTLVGDESIARRPMERIIKPLAEMGVQVEARDGKYTPLIVHGNPDLKAIEYHLPVASAQVKTCVLLAGLFAKGVTVVQEPMKTRDHTELALREFGATVESSRGRVSVEGPVTLKGRDLVVPGDLSSAAFFLVAALIRPGSDIVIQNVGLNPTRAGLIDFLLGMGADIKMLRFENEGGEAAGDLRVRHAKITGGVIDKETTAMLIDEIPVLAILGAVSEHGLTVRDARELRIKETDRIATLSENLGRMGVDIEVYEDGFYVPGRQTFRAAVLDSFGDHRIAMAFAVAALAADGPSEIHHADAASVSYPEFYDTLRSIAGHSVSTSNGPAGLA